MEKAFDSKLEGDVAGFDKPESWTLRIFLTVVSVVVIGMAFEVDPWVDGLVKSCRDNQFLGLAKTVSVMGDFLGVLSIGLLGWGGARWRKLPEVETLFKAMICAAILSGVCANLCRCVTGRARPNTQSEAGWYGPSKGVGFSEAHRFQAFPSAHTAVVAGFLAPVVIASNRRRSDLRAIGLGVLGCAGIALMAWARVWLGAHHLSDVLAAVILGVSVAFALCRDPDQRGG